MTVTAVPVRRNAALTIARVLAGVLGIMKVGGITYFAVIAPEESVWRGPWIDVPTLGGLFASTALLLVVAFATRLSHRTRITAGFVSAGLEVVVTIVKVSLYDEPESMSFLVFAAILAGILVWARRAVD